MKDFTLKPLVTFSTRHPWLVIILSFSITLLFLYPMRNLKIEPDVMSLLPASVQEELKGNQPEQSTDFDRIAVMISGPGVFTYQHLKLFESTYKKIQTSIGAEKIIEPFSQTLLLKSGSRLMPATLSPTGKAPVNPEEAAVFKKRLTEDPFATGLITSENRDVLLVYFLVRKGMDYLDMMDRVTELLRPLKEEVTVTVTGTAPFSAETERFLTKDFIKLLILVIAVILLSYYLGFRSKRAVFIPILLIISGTIFALGGMAALGFKLTMVSIVTPPLILTLGSSYSIHVLNAYYSFLRSNKNHDKQNAIITSVTGVSPTVFLASLTTIIGLLSLLLASIQQTREFAIATAFGIFSTALLSLTLLPAFLQLQRVPEQKKLNELSSDFLSRLIHFIGPRIIRKKYAAFIIIALIFTGFLLIYPHIVFNTNPFKYYPPNSDIIKGNHFILEKIGGLEEISITFSPKTNTKGFFLNPEALNSILNIEKKIRKLDNVSFLFSYPSYLNYAGKVMSGKEGFLSSRGLNLLVARLFHTAEGDQAYFYVDKDFTRLTTTIKVYNNDKKQPIDEKDTAELKSRLTSILSDNTPGTMEWQVSAMSFAFLDLSHQMRRDFLVSTLGALIAIGIVAFLAFKSISQSILALIPLIMGIFSSLIFMVIFRVPLDMTTIMVSCISVGVGVDDSIHFLLRHHLNKERYPDNSEKAVYETLIHAGRPIILTTVSIVSGLLFLTLAQFQPIRYFGLLIVFTLTTAMLATLLLLPPLLNKHNRKMRNNDE